MFRDCATEKKVLQLKQSFKLKKTKNTEQQ